MMFTNTWRILTTTLLDSSASIVFVNYVGCSQGRLLCNSKSRIPLLRRPYSDKTQGKRIMKHDERTQLHLSIVNDPKLTPRQKHVMITALMADVQFYDQEYGRLVYADPFGKDLLQFIKTRKKIPMIGIPSCCVVAYFLPISVYAQAFLAIFLSFVSLSDFYRILRGMRRRIFFIYFEPQHQVYTALTLTGTNDFDPVHFTEKDVQPDILSGPHKVLLHDQTYSAYHDRKPFINDWFYEKIWKENLKENENNEEENNSETQQNKSSGD